MLASVSILHPGHRANAVDVVRLEMPARGASIVFHPRYQGWLKKVGLDSALAIMKLPGEIVCGHPDRHVVKVTLDHGRVLYLKREHVTGLRVRLKNALAGYGFVSRCEREAITLQWLSDAGLPAPHWLAYGTTDDGQAFLLLDDLAGATELHQMTLTDDVASRIGAAIAELHEAGVGTPDLSAKHVFIDRQSAAITLIDWQNSPKPGSVSWLSRIDSLARFASSLPSPDDRLARIGLRIYLRSCRGEKPTFRNAITAIQQRIKKRSNRSTSSVQRQTGEAIRLIWRDDERLVTIPDLDWPRSWERASVSQKREWSSFSPLARALAWLRGKPWRSPAAIASRLLAQLQKADIPAPRLLAYGQRLKSLARSQSFLLTDQSPMTGSLEKHDLVNLARLIRRAHDAGVRIRQDSSAPAVVKSTHCELQINAVAAWHRDSRSRIAGDLVRVLQNFKGPLSRTDRLRFVRAYQTQGSLMPLSRLEIAKIVGRA